MTVLTHLRLPEDFARIGVPERGRFGMKDESVVQCRCSQSDHDQNPHKHSDFMHVETLSK
jgi:hypothetical protein